MGLEWTSANSVLSISQPASWSNLMYLPYCYIRPASWNAQIVSVLSMWVHVSFEDHLLRQHIFFCPLKYVNFFKEFPQVIWAGKKGCFPLQSCIVMDRNVIFPLIISDSLELCFQKQPECDSGYFTTSLWTLSLSCNLCGLLRLTFL